MYYNMGQVATELRCSYENVRKQFNRYRDKELKDHWIKNGRQFLLDDEAVDFLKSHKPVNITIVENEAANEKIDQLNEQLKAALLELHSVEKEYREYTLAMAPKLALAEKSEKLKEDFEKVESTNRELAMQVEELRAALAASEQTSQEQQQALETEKTRKLKFSEFWKRRK